MKLLFDHHLSHKLVKRLADIFPNSTQTRFLGMSTAEDIALWNHAKQNGFTLVSLDSDFYDLSVLRGHPPKLIWLRCGNSTVDKIERLLRAKRETDRGICCGSLSRVPRDFLENESLSIFRRKRCSRNPAQLNLS